MGGGGELINKLNKNIMSMENSGTPIRLEVEGKNKILEKTIKRLKVGTVALSATTVSLLGALVMQSDLGKEKTAGYSESNKTEEVKNELWSHTTPETTSEILDQLDKKFTLGDVSDEEVERINQILDDDQAYHKYLEELNTNPDDGTIETGGYVPGSEVVR